MRSSVGAAGRGDHLLPGRGDQQGHFEIAVEVYAPGFVAHRLGRGYTLAEDDASGRMMRAAFPDLSVVIERSIVDEWSTYDNLSIMKQLEAGAAP